MGGLLHLVQRGRDWAGPQPAQAFLAVPNVTAHPPTASVPITVLMYNGPLLCRFNVPVKGLNVEVYEPSKWSRLQSQYDLITCHRLNGNCGTARNSHASSPHYDESFALTARQCGLRIAGFFMLLAGGIMFSTCPSVRSFVCRRYCENDILKTKETILL